LVIFSPASRAQDTDLGFDQWWFFLEEVLDYICGLCFWGAMGNWIKPCLQALDNQAHVAELADALDSGSFNVSWTPLDLLDSQRPSLDIRIFQNDPFGLFWPCFHARGVQYGVQWTR
jgi:hypothetical protein